MKEMQKISDADPTEYDLTHEIIEWIKVILTAAFIALFLNSYVITNSYVPTPSMENTIMAGSRLIGSRLAYQFGKDPERGDIVIFKHKAEPGTDKTRLVKRIIGLPGETVDMKDGLIYINQSDTPLEETYLPEVMQSSDASYFEIPDGCYLMLGDNRNNSLDARYWNDPYVPKNEIQAKVLFQYYPKIGRIH